MSWDYRILKRTVGEDTGYGIHEVYYAPDGTPEMCSENPSIPFGETAEELADDLLGFAEALKKPILDYATFENREPPAH